MKIKEGNKVIKKGTIKSIVDIECSQKYEIFIFQGSLSENDIIIKYSEHGKRARTPKHIHWVVDVLMKLQGNKELTTNFLIEIQEDWKNCKALKNNDYAEISTIINNGTEEFNIESFESLNEYGEYDIDFLFTLMKLLMVQEKTNREDAYMFGNIISKLLEEELDIFSIMSTVGFNGR